MIMHINVLEQYIETGNFRDLEHLLNQDASLLKSKTSHDVSPLLLACYYNKPQIVQAILNYTTSTPWNEAAPVECLQHLKMIKDPKPEIVEEGSSNVLKPPGIVPISIKKI